MLTAPSPLAFVGIAFSFWTSAYLASRTSYSSATRVVRWALIVMGVRFMHDVLYSNAKSLDEALLWQRLFFWTFVLAPTLWYCWSLTFSPLGHRTRWLCSLVAIGLGFGFVAARITPNLLFLDDQFVLSRQAPFGFLSNSIKPGPLYPFFCLYYVGMLAGALLCFVLAYRRATLRAERHALAVLVTAALILMLGEVYVTITI